MASFTGNVLRIGAYLDDQVSKKLTGIRGAFDGLARSKGFAAVAQGIGIGAGIGIWGQLSMAVGRATDFLKGSIDAASDFNETVTKSEQIFGPAQDAMMAWASTASSAFGQSQKQALDTASTFAGLFQTVGMAADESANMAQRMVELGSDLASFFNTDVAQAVGALRSGLAGESEPLRRFNVFLTETTLAAKAAEMGLTKVGGKLTEQQKIMARYAIILEQTAAAQGDFARTSDGLANQQRSLTAELADLQTTIGQKVLPYMVLATRWFRDLVDEAQKMAEAINKDVVPALESLGRALGKSGDEAEDFPAKLARIALAAAAAAVATAKLGLGINLVVPVSIAFAIKEFGGPSREELLARFNERSGLVFKTELPGHIKDLITQGMAAVRLPSHIADLIARGRPDVKAATTELFSDVSKVVSEARTRAVAQAKEFRQAGIAAIEKMAEGIRSARSEIDSALDQLAIDMKNAMTRQAEIGRLGGLLTGADIADGLAAGDEGVNKSAQYLVALIEARLDELTEGAYTRGKRAALALAAGFAEKLPANLRSELRDVVEAAKEYEAIRGTFDKPAGSGARLLASSLDTLSKASGSASSALSDLRQKVSDTKDALKTAAGLISEARGQLALFAQASGSYVDFSPKLITVEQAAQRVNAVLARVGRSLAGLRASSAGSLDAVRSAFDRLRYVAGDYFDAVHRGYLRQIDDARAAMMASLDAQVGAINAEVEAYREQLEAKRQARQEEQLKEALASAETPEDVKRATEQLNDFYEDQQLRRLESQARAKIAELEKERDTNNKLYDAQVEAENQRYEQQKAAFEKMIELLTSSLDTMKALWGTKTEEVLKLLQSFVAPFGAAGQALVSAFMSAISGAVPAVAAVGAVGAGGYQPGSKRVTSPGVLDQSDIAALEKYIKNLEAVQNRTIEQQLKLNDYQQRLADYTQRLAGSTGMASGGPVRPGETYLVGERGPEYLHVGSTGGFIEPAVSGAPVVIKLTMDGREVASVVDRHLYYTLRTTGS